jgi:hypothetical protein
MVAASSKNVFFMQTRNRRTGCCTISHPGLLILLSISMGKHLKFCKPCCHDFVAGMSTKISLWIPSYRNYVIQYILELNVRWATDEILDKLEGHYGYLSMQKFSSNVVEKCIKEAHEPKRVKIIHELISDPKLLHILLDQFGNYVIQTALRECEVIITMQDVQY